MCRPRVTIDAPVLTTAIGIDAGVETDVGTLIVGDQAGCIVPQKLRAQWAVFGWIPIFFTLEINNFEPIGWIARRPSSFDCRFLRHRQQTIPDFARASSKKTTINMTFAL